MEYTRHPCGCESLLDDAGRAIWVCTLPHRHLPPDSEFGAQMELPGFEQVEPYGGCDVETLIPSREHQEWPSQTVLEEPF